VAGTGSDLLTLGFFAAAFAGVFRFLAAALGGLFRVFVAMEILVSDAPRASVK
jgi:hypothetical protein